MALTTLMHDLAPSRLDMPAETRMLFGVFGVDETQPKSIGTGLMDTTISAHGDLTLSVETDQEAVEVGDNLGFRLVVNYSGDQPLSDVALQVGTQTLASLDKLNCSTQAASNCVLDDRSGNVHARFDIQPGGSVEITGQMLSLRNQETHYFGGVVWGPVSLSEPNTVNNFSRALIVQPLFADGFD